MDGRAEDFRLHFPQLNIRENEPMSRHTTFAIGGTADMYVEPAISEMADVIGYCMENEIPVTIVGNGSNILVSDDGIRGMVIALGNNAADIRVEDDHVYAEAGARLTRVANIAAEHGLSGIEFAAGIPGTVGGAMMMNAGAYGGEMCDIVENVTVVNYDGDIEIWQASELELSYRHSRMMDEDVIILSACFRLHKGNAEEIKAVMEDYMTRRKSKQPLEYPSAGSTFKRPKGYYAGKLIMDSGLAGYRVGGAMVSEKHCGFVVNAGGATAADVSGLIDDVIERVRENFGVTLEPEVRKIGDFTFGDIT